eukprot:7380029-Prymnesium_polylepis.3
MHTGPHVHNRVSAVLARTPQPSHPTPPNPKERSASVENEGQRWCGPSVTRGTSKGRTDEAPCDW